jgi:hypothetical protein
MKSPPNVQLEIWGKYMSGQIIDGDRITIKESIKRIIITIRVTFKDLQKLLQYHNLLVLEEISMIQTIKLHQDNLFCCEKQNYVI